MDTIIEHRLLARILTSLAESKEERSLTSHIARQLCSSQDGKEKAVLAEMLASLLFESQDKYSENVLSDFVKGLVLSATDDREEIIHKNLQLGSQIALSVPAILDRLLEETESIISTLIFAVSKSHIASDDAFEINVGPFLDKYCSFRFEKNQKSENPEFFQTLYPVVIQHLCFLKTILLSDTKEAESARTHISDKSVLLHLIFSLIPLRNLKIAELSCHVFRLFLGNFDSVLPGGTSEMVWDGIKVLLESPIHADLSFSIWLRWVSLSGPSSRPSEEMLRQENYWILLQNSLTTGFNERRKFCLYILNSSLRLLSGPVDNKLIKYDPSSVKDSAAWSKYSTMIEIISLSTSTNQFLATVPDLRRLLKPFSPIYGSWIVILMTLGLTSSCGPLQKAVWEFLLSLEGKELGKLLEDERGKNFINDIFLPYSIAAHHFSVQKGKDNHCEYGDRLAGFLKKVVIQSRDAAVLLKFVDNRQDTIFAPARVYVMKGIMDGVLETFGHGLGVEEMAMLVSISKMKRFALLKTDLCISICFRILLSIKLHRTMIEPFFDSMAEIFAGKEYLITHNFSRSLRELFADNNDISSELFSMFEYLSSLLKAYNTEDIPTKILFRAIFLLILLDDRGQCLGKVLDSISVEKNRFRFLSLLFSCKLLVEGILQNSGAHKLLLEVLQNIGNNLPGNVSNKYAAELAALFYYQRTHRFLNQLSNTALMPILKSSWDLIHKQGWVRVPTNPQPNYEFDTEVERLSGDLLTICDATVSALIEKGHRVGFPRKAEVLELIKILPLPILDQNKHENMVKLRVISKLLYSGYSLLNSLITQSTEEELNDEYVTILFDTTRKMLRYIDKASLLRILECFRTVFRNAPASTKCYPRLDLLVRELWDCADVTSVVAVESLLEVSLIRTIFDVSVIRASFETNKALAETLPEIGNEIMKLSKGKRSLAPVYAGKLREAYLSAPDVFCACKWVVDILIEFINYSPSKDPDFFVENSVARVFDEISSQPNHYEQYYEEREEMAQVYIFDILSRLDPNSFSASAFANCLRDKIYAPWELNKPGMPVYSKWKKTSQLQVLLVLERFVTAEKSASFLNTAISTLCNEPHPRYRFILEWVVALCIIRFPENRDRLWGYLQAPANPNPRLQASLLRVAIMVARELEENFKEEFYTELLYTVIPLSNNNKVAVRHQATSMVLELWDDLAQWQHLRDNVVFQRLRQSILSSDFFKQIVAAGKLESEKTFNAKSNYTFAGIFSGSYLLGGDEADIIPLELFASLENQNSRASFIPTGTAKQLESSTNMVEFTKTEMEALVEAPLQTKSGSWDAKALVEANEHRRIKASPRRDQGPDIIVIASLIENAYNLGGLSRVSEIMGVTTLCFNSKDSLKLKDFTSVSVSSEVWLPIEELKITDITDYIRSKRLAGYSAVGVEQTDRSVILGNENNQLPKKVVLLLGSEKYGIPAELLAELDLCVEIPQKGETRSMNVQTAAAVVLYEFCRRFG